MPITVNGYDTLTAIIWPIDATNQRVTWTTSNPSVVIVEPSGLTDYLTITATGKKVGTAIITATAQDSGRSVQCIVNVSDIPIPAVGIEIFPASPIIVKASTVKTLSINVIPSNATDKRITSATWTTSDPNKVEISDEGIGSKLITLKEIGTETISVNATIGGKDFPASAVLYIEPKNICSIPVTGMTIENKNLNSLAVGKSTQLSVKLEPVHATCKKITWLCEDESIARVTENGILYPLKTGKTKITAVVTNISDKELKTSFDVQVVGNTSADEPIKSPDVPDEPTNQIDNSGKGCNTAGFGSILFAMALLPFIKKKK